MNLFQLIIRQNIWIYYFLLYFRFPKQAFFNSDALNLVRTLITGGATQELEQILAEGCGLVQGSTAEDENVQIARNRSRVALLPLEDETLVNFSVSNFSCSHLP